MAILIKGMAMPTEPMVLILFPDGNISTEEYEIGANAKAVELPPHGRLIDADALKIEMIEQKLSGYVGHDWREVSQVIDDAPTIIESEGEDG